MNSKIIKAIFATGMLLSGVQMAQAATTPLGMMRFCDAYASQCRPDNVSKVTMTDELMALLQNVNSRVNRAIRPVAERGTDKWSLNPRSGDCEDYVLSKRAQLIRAGVPAGALRIAITKSRRGMPHAILVVKSSRGDYILDNLTANVRSLGGSGYRIQSMSTSNPMVWG